MSLLWAIFLMGTWVSAGSSSPEIVGHWFYHKKIFQGVEMPEPPEATLRLHFEFYADGSDKLYWWHEGEDDLCTRRGRYHLDGNDLVDEVVWVDPKNDSACARDPDMQMGKISRTPIAVSSQELRFFLVLGDDSLIYVWKKLPNADPGLSFFSSLFGSLVFP